MVINYLTVACVTLLPVAVSALLQLPKCKAWFEKRTPVSRSLWYGVIYGFLTCFVIILSTVRLFGNTGNVSYVVDAPPIIAGLLFDAPAGIIAALIGGICRYATVLWAEDGGAKKIHISYSINNNAVFLEFVDNGILYDPTQSQEPDTTLPPHERRIGGLGLLMVKKLASSVEYAQRDDWNDLKLIFKFETDPVNEVWNDCGNR